MVGWLHCCEERVSLVEQRFKLLEQERDVDAELDRSVPVRAIAGKGRAKFVGEGHRHAVYHSARVG